MVDFCHDDVYHDAEAQKTQRGAACASVGAAPEACLQCL